jgi:hypothetical protein
MNPHIPWQPVRSTQTLAPKRIATETFTDASAAVARLEEIYGRNTAFLRERFESYLTGEPVAARVRATYPVGADTAFSVSRYLELAV